MPTAADLVQETRAHLLSGSRQEYAQLAEDLDAVETAIDITGSLGGVQRGAVISIDLELMYVFSVAGLVATVKRGYLGSTAAVHTNGAMIEVNPTWSDFQILRSLNQEIDSYSSPRHGLYQMKVVDLTFTGARVGYDLTGVTDLIDIYDVRYSDYGSFYSWPRVGRWVLARNQLTSDFASGFALFIEGVNAPGRPIRVQYKARFATLSALATDLTTTGLPTTAYDIPPLGAAARLVAAREVPRSRTDAQPEPRRAAEVPPGTSRQAAGGLLALRNQRLAEESARLHAHYPNLARVG
jgi:hypothetical protein